MRYFHLYADDVTIREIDNAEYLKINSQDYNSNKPKQIIVVAADFIGVTKGNQYVSVTLKQLKQVLEATGKYQCEANAACAPEETVELDKGFLVKNRILIKMEMCSETRARSKDEFGEIIRWYPRVKPREAKECGVWIDGVKVLGDPVEFQYRWTEKGGE